MSDQTHPYKCPNCDTTIRATNIEWYMDDGDWGDVIPNRLRPFTKYNVRDGEQLHYCPNDDCRVVRLFPGEQE